MTTCPMKRVLNSVDTSSPDTLPMRMLLNFICNPSDRQMMEVGSASRVRHFVSSRIHAIFGNSLVSVLYPKIVL